MIYYIGGVKVEDGVRYLTAETPPADDNSNKVPTTEWVKEKLDNAVGGGMNATVKATTASLNMPYGRTYAPSGGGTWWCYGESFYSKTSATYNGAYASGAVVHEVRDVSINNYSTKGFGIKIA